MSAPPDLSRGQIADYYSFRAPKIQQSNRAEWRGPCPVHGGERQSFSVEAETGRAVCHSECGRGWNVYSLEVELSGVAMREAVQAVAGIVGLELQESRADDWGRDDVVGRGRKQVKKTAPGPRRKLEDFEARIEQVYQYEDAAGAVVYEQVRLTPKDFRIRTPKPGGGHEWKYTGIRIPYRLPELLEASSIVLVEGEKDVEAVRALGIVATTLGGAESWNSEAARYFEGRRVLIVPDADTAGWAMAAMAARDLLPGAAVVKVLFLPGLGSQAGKDGKRVRGEDISDWIERGGDRDQLAALASSQAIEIKTESVADELRAGPPDFSWLERVPTFDRLKWRERQWLVANWIPLGHVVYVTGKSGSLKTTFVLDMCCSIATGGFFAESFQCRKVPILTLDRENSEPEIADIRKRIGRGGVEFPGWRYWGRFSQAEPPKLDDPRIIQWVRRYRGLVVLDSMVRFHEGSERDNEDLAKTTELLRALARAGAAGVLVIHHAGKSEESVYRGGEEILAGADTMISIVRSKADPMAIKVSHVKSRGCIELEKVPFRLTEAGFKASNF